MYQDTDLQMYLAKAHLQEVRKAIAQERVHTRLAWTPLRHRAAACLEALRGGLVALLARGAQ